MLKTIALMHMDYNLLFVHQGLKIKVKHRNEFKENTYINYTYIVLQLSPYFRNLVMRLACLIFQSVASRLFLKSNRYETISPMRQNRK